MTMPFKHEAWTLARRHTPRARRAGAANTLRFDAEGWWADNTDGVGLVRDITLHAAVPLAGARLLLVGAGGAAAGVVQGRGIGLWVTAAGAVLLVVGSLAARLVGSEAQTGHS